MSGGVIFALVVAGLIIIAILSGLAQMINIVQQGQVGVVKQGRR